MLDDLSLKIIARSVDEKGERMRQDLDAQLREQNARERVASSSHQHAAAPTPAFSVPQTFESVATRLQKYAEAGLTEKDAVLAGVASSLAGGDGVELSDGIQNQVLLHAASSLLAVNSPLPHIALALLYGDD